jgi:hypothetical protein
MITVAFQPQFNWRKLGYLFYTDSMKYRDVLNNNPQWTVTELPPLGAQLSIQSELSATNGGLQQSTFVFGLTAGNESDVIFPYDTTTEYQTAVDRYSVYSTLFQDSLNGFSADSNSAVTGKQYG